MARVVYRGSALPSLNGVFLFGDYTGARMAALKHCGTTTSPTSIIRKQCSDTAPAEACFGSVGGAAVTTALTAIVEGNDGEIYFVANRSSLLKVVPGN